MKVLLIYPDTDPLSVIPSSVINIEPLGLEYLAGDLSQHDVTILDMKIERNWKKIFENSRPDIVGITGTVIHTSRIIEILKYIKKVNREIITVVGGPHATLVPDEFKVPSVDYIVMGQRPDSFSTLIEAQERRQTPENIDGVIGRTSTGWSEPSKKTSLNNLDHLSMPRRDLTKRYRSKYRHLFWQPVALMITSVGCPHACNFCPCPALTGRKVLRRSPELVVREMCEIEEPYIYIGDDNLLYDYQHAMRIAELVREAGLKKQFYVLSRVDSINKHPDLVEKWAEIGLKKIFLGLESPDDEEIKALNKKGTVTENNTAINILHQNGIDPLGAFIINPNYTRSDFNRILDYMDLMKIFYFEFTILTPFPGTEFYDEQRSLLSSNDRRLFDLAHTLLPTRLPVKQFYSEFGRLHRRAMSPLRAYRIKPTVSPFRNFGYIRIAPHLLSLLLSSKKAYRMLNSRQSK
jgi:hopanoid C-3 methylase